jgi:hypothetical protein
MPFIVLESVGRVSSEMPGLRIHSADLIPRVPYLVNQQDPASDRVLTWTALLAKWTEFAKAGVALPPDAEGDRWRESIAPIITLHAASLALDDLGCLEDPSEVATGLDRGEILIRDATHRLHDVWYATDAGREAETMPSEILKTIEDARRSLARANALGTEWVVAVDRLEVPDLSPILERLIGTGFTGDVLGAEPGTLLIRGAPLLFIRGGAADISIGSAEPRPAAEPRQVYRRVEDGDAPRVVDHVAPLLEALPPGRPLLFPIIEQGDIVHRPDPAQAPAWRAAQEDLFATHGEPRLDIQEPGDEV